MPKLVVRTKCDVSARVWPLREVVPLNRAGDSEACLTQREIVDKYVRQGR